MSVFRVFSSLALALLVLDCGAVYPEVATPIRSLPSSVAQNPPPPADLLFIRFAGAQIPAKTRDGRIWDATGNALPDAFAKLIVDKKEILVTPVQSDTLRPTWRDQPIANYQIPEGATVRIELWDSNPIHNHPICVHDIDNIHQEALSDANVEIACSSGARIEIIVDPAHARLGLGLYYELRTEQVFVTRVLRESPASRAKLKRGDAILKIQGVDVAKMEEGQAQSLLNANASTGVVIRVKSPDGVEREITLKEGPVYPFADEDVRIEG
jgi:PDZ domain/C2 domain